MHAATLEPEPKYVPVSVYDPEHALFFVALKTKNVPGALGDIATRIGKAGVNIMSTSNYSLPDKPDSVISFFAESKDKALSENDFKKVLRSSSYVLDVHVRKATSKFLVDDFAFPLMYFPAGRGILLPQSGVTAMFQNIVNLFGSGGESILFKAGYSVAKQATDELVVLFGEDEMRNSPQEFGNLYNSLGWGRMEMAEANPDGSTVLKLHEGFEGSGVKASRPICHFSRGLIVGASERVQGREVSCVEEQCIAMGAPYCQFRVKPK
jgi:predicted hydrocarbon binding protein